MSYVVGLTGGIGSGKSLVAGAFAAHGVPVADADVASHAVTRAGRQGFDAVIDAFGREFVGADGELDRGALRRHVFERPQERALLEKTLHPIIAAELRNHVAHWTSPYGILVVPLLLERGGLRSWVNRVLVIDCREDQQVERVTARSGLTVQEVRAIMATQLARSDRLVGADDVLDNSGPPDAIAPQVAALDRRYRELAAPSASHRPRVDAQ